MLAIKKRVGRKEPSVFTWTMKRPSAVNICEWWHLGWLEFFSSLSSYDYLEYLMTVGIHWYNLYIYRRMSECLQLYSSSWAFSQLSFFACLGILLLSETQQGLCLVIQWAIREIIVSDAFVFCLKRWPQLERKLQMIKQRWCSNICPKHSTLQKAF